MPTGPREVQYAPHLHGGHAPLVHSQPVSSMTLVLLQQRTEQLHSACKRHRLRGGTEDRRQAGGAGALPRSGLAQAAEGRGGEQKALRGKGRGAEGAQTS